jgi:uncharacterized membrane protein YedE/YeeE
MIKYIKYLTIGIVFGLTLAKAEIISWYKIYEMFRFDSFHMYGVIGSAIVIGIVLVQVIKWKHLKSYRGEEIIINEKDKSVSRYLFGGIIFGLGWALVGACPGPMFILLGYGYWIFLLVILSAIFGTFLYGLVRDKLPH